MEKLLEEIKRFKLISGYDPNLTLTENVLFLNEQGLLAKTLQRYSDDAIKLLSKEAKQLPMFANQADDVIEGFFKNLRQGKVAAKEAAKLQSEVLKSGLRQGQMAAVFDSAVEGYTKQLMSSQDNLARQFQNASPADRAQMLKNYGYPETSINSILKSADNLGAARTTASAAQDASVAGKSASEVAGVSKSVDAIPVKPNLSQRVMDNARKYKDNLISTLKTSGWKKALAVAAGLGITGAALWWLFKENGVTAEDLPQEPPADTGGGSPTTYQIPSELGDVEGVKKFQNWLDANHPGWVNKYGTLNGDVNKGFGKFGPSTNRAWQNVEWRTEYLNSLQQQTPTNTPPDRTQGVQDLINTTQASTRANMGRPNLGAINSAATQARPPKIG